MSIASLKDPLLREGDVIAERYRIEGKLGVGGMGVVYAGRHTLTDRSVAIKLLRGEFAEDRQTLRRFFTEAKAAASLRHPNVVDVLDMGETDEGLPFMVHELLEGEALDARVKRAGPLPWDEARTVMLPVMDALASVHDAGILHRDLKPGNVFLSRGHDDSLVPKLLDFGIVKLVGVEHSLATENGVMVGSPAYMAPEQVRGQTDLDGRADVWGVGVLLYEVLTGKRPFEARNAMAIVMQIVMEEPAPIATLAPHLPAPVQEAITRALVKDRDQRWPDMRAFAAAL